MFESKKSKKKRDQISNFKICIQEKSGLYYVSTLVPGVGFCTPPTPGKKMAAPALLFGRK